MSFFKVSSRSLVKAGLIASAMMGVPMLSFAATYAYVNTAGNVSTVIADTPAQALATAPNKDAHSGVVLLVNPAAGLGGNN